MKSSNQEQVKINNKKNNCFVKNQSAITLVAILITIIVLIILAVVGIKIITDSKVIQNADSAASKTSIAQEKEKIKFAIASAKMDGNGKILTENLNKELQFYFNNSDEVVENENGWIYKASNIYYIDSEGNIYLMQNDNQLNDVNVAIEVELKSIEKTKMIIEIKAMSNKSIDRITSMDTYNNNLVEYDNISNNSTITSEMHLENENYIYIKVGGEYYFYKIKANYIEVANENETKNNLDKGFYAFGAKGKYYYKELEGSYTFSNDKFGGDPIVDTHKKGYLIEDIEISYSNKYSRKKDFLFESANVLIDITKFENDKFYITLNGYFLEMINSAKVYINDIEANTGTIKNNNVSINGNFAEDETCIFDVTFSDNSKCKIKISLNIESEVESIKIGNEGGKINTNGLWYYVKYGAGSRWKYKWINDKEFSINNTTMGGDPAPGTQKALYLLKTASIIYENISD